MAKELTTASDTKADLESKIVQLNEKLVQLEEANNSGDSSSLLSRIAELESTNTVLDNTIAVLIGEVTQQSDTNASLMEQSNSLQTEFAQITKQKDEGINEFGSLAQKLLVNSDKALSLEVRFEEINSTIASQQLEVEEMKQKNHGFQQSLDVSNSCST